jgi:hypothetical protein
VRTRTYIARRLCTLGNGDIEAGAITLASAGSLQKGPKDRFKAVNVELGFGLPMGTAILTVLDQESFSVYHVRVCEELKTDRFRTLVNKTSLESLGRVTLSTSLRPGRPVRPGLVSATATDTSGREMSRTACSKSYGKAVPLQRSTAANIA